MTMKYGMFTGLRSSEKLWIWRNDVPTTIKKRVKDQTGFLIKKFNKESSISG